MTVQSRDLDPLGQAHLAEGKRALEHDGVVVGRIDPAAAHDHVAAAIDVDGVAVGVDVEILDHEIIAAGRQDGEVAAARDAETRQAHASRILEGDGLVALSDHGRVLRHELGHGLGG